mgnify:CR=1
MLSNERHLKKFHRKLLDYSKVFNHFSSSLVRPKRFLLGLTGALPCHYQTKHSIGMPLSNRMPQQKED